MQKGMEKAAVNMGSTARAPTGPMPLTCTRVDSPTTIREAKTIHDRYESPRPDSLATITGVTSRAADAMRLNWEPRPRVVRRGGFSCASKRGFGEAVVTFGIALRDVLRLGPGATVVRAFYWGCAKVNSTLKPAAKQERRA